MNSHLIQQQKHLLRKSMKALSKKEPSSPTAFSALLTSVQKLLETTKARSVLLYAPLPHEPNLLALLDQSSNRFFFPRMLRDKLELYQWTPGATWIKGPHHVQEPDPKTWRLASIAEIDLALIPGLAFDAQGGRLGWGKGYFDRLLGNPKCHALKVGTAWSWQLLPKIPSEEHDIKMDFVVTPHAE